jgi:hypothetical protein
MMNDNILPVKLPDAVVMEKIHVIRGKKVMLDFDLAKLYDIETKQLKRAVRRNIDRFPEDFMIELSTEEFKDLRSQNDTSSWGGSRYVPMAFNEHGVLMLSSVLNSKRAIKVNIQIMRVFVSIREMILIHNDLVQKMDRLDNKVAKQDEKIALVFQYLQKFIDVQKKPKKHIGYKRKGEE